MLRAFVVAVREDAHAAGRAGGAGSPSLFLSFSLSFFLSRWHRSRSREGGSETSE
jgi:hypothetical protein